ncbi:hypothetical protein [Streptomyces sp. NPDC051662]|uniref:hypothetical protein n=1 Tax=Streptomyces sp. NPDC051662 TaxID=3154750 RepID=UPI003420F1EE
MASISSSAFSISHRGRQQHRADAEAWAAIHSALDNAVSTLTAGNTTLPSATTGRDARAQLVAARFLFNRQAERYIAAARTRVGRAWRRRQVTRSSFTKALDDAAAYLTRLERDHEGPFFLPQLFVRSSSGLPVRGHRAPGRHRAAAAA